MPATLYSSKISTDGLDVEYEVLPVLEIPVETDPRLSDIKTKLQNLEDVIAKSEAKIEEYNKEIERLTNHADGLDYTVAVASGIITGIIDSVFVGEFSFSEGSKWGEEKVNSFVNKTSKFFGYNGDDPAGAISFLEKKFPIPADKATAFFGGGLQHHLRDFSHHPSLLGLFFSLLTQFTGKAYGTSTSGAFDSTNVSDSGLIGDDLPTKILYGVVFWFFHLVSDMAGSSGTVAMGKLGTGIPGPILSLAKELSALPIFKHGEGSLSQTISKLFNGTLLGDRDPSGKIVNPQKFDLRGELGVLQQLGKQAIPVIINECIVRGFYFVRHLYGEIKEKNIHSFKELERIDWKNVLPVKNRTIVRMLTIATGTFTAFDVIDAAIRSAIKSGGINPAFWANLVLRINFVGVGRFAVALYTDVRMGAEKRGVEQDRRIEYNVLLHSLNAKVFYKQAETWIAAEDAAKAIAELEETSSCALNAYMKELRYIEVDMDSIKRGMPKALERNKGLREELLDCFD